jgi:hypothetical protein
MLIKEQDLKNIFDYLKNKYKTINIIANCINGTELETLDIDKVLEFYNPISFGIVRKSY